MKVSIKDGDDVAVDLEPVLQLEVFFEKRSVLMYNGNVVVGKDGSLNTQNRFFTSL